MEERNAEPGAAFDTIEVALPWGNAASCSEELERTFAPLSDPFYLHFSHVYETGSCMYMILHLHAADDAEVSARLRATPGRVRSRSCSGTAGPSRTTTASAPCGQAVYAASDSGRVHARIARALDHAGVIHPPLLSAMATSSAG